jgi:phosphohistidine phosphatase
MNLYLIRHADALALGENGIDDDAERPLSEAGKGQAKGLAHALLRQGVRLDLVLTSPLLRAKQTAEEMVKYLSEPRPEIQVTDFLTPSMRRKRLSNEVVAAARTNIALVGHQPDLGAYAAWLVGEKKAQLDIAKAGIAFIQCDEEPAKGAGTLLWLVTPAWFGVDGKAKAAI